MDKFFKTYSSIFHLSKKIDFSNVPIQVLMVQADECRIKACDNNDKDLYEKAAYSYFLCSTYFFYEYNKNKDIYNFTYTSITKYEQLKSLFSQIYCNKSFPPKELLRLLDIQINFIKDFLKILKNYNEYEDISYKYESLLYSDRILKCQIKSNFYYINRDIINAKSQMKISIDLTKDHINFLKNDVFEDIFDIIHLRTEEVNLKLRLAEYHELISISLFRTDTLLTLSNLLSSLNFIDEAIEINSNFCQLFEKKDILFKKIATILHDNLDKWDDLYSQHKTNQTLLKIMHETNAEKIEAIISNDLSNSNSILILNSGNFNNSGIIGNNNIFNDYKHANTK
ncbi:MAG: hypothetical protein ACRC6A_06980 [Fusobacteriaceae bacterium]